jgi:hypothetical protein
MEKRKGELDEAVKEGGLCRQFYLSHNNSFKPEIISFKNDESTIC